MLVFILLIVFGIIALRRNEFRISRNRVIRGNSARNLGLFSIAMAVVGLFIPILIALIVVCVVGWSMSEPINA